VYDGSEEAVACVRRLGGGCRLYDDLEEAVGGGCRRRLSVVAVDAFLLVLSTARRRPDCYYGYCNSENCGDRSSKRSGINPRFENGLPYRLRILVNLPPKASQSSQTHPLIFLPQKGAQIVLIYYRKSLQSHSAAQKSSGGLRSVATLYCTRVLEYMT
jgi:hypothetical protein